MPPVTLPGLVPEGSRFLGFLAFPAFHVSRHTDERRCLWLRMSWEPEVSLPTSRPGRPETCALLPPPAYAQGGKAGQGGSLPPAERVGGIGGGRG